MTLRAVYLLLAVRRPPLHPLTLPHRIQPPPLRVRMLSGSKCVVCGSGCVSCVCLISLQPVDAEMDQALSAMEIPVKVDRGQVEQKEPVIVF